MEAISIRDLVTNFDHELTRLNYKNTTLRNYRVFWKQLLSYSLSGNSDARPIGVRRSAGSCRALWCARCFPAYPPRVHCQPRRLAPRR